MLKNCSGGTLEDYRAMLEEACVPIYMASGLYNYVEHGITPGSFLTAILCNDLKESLGHADDQNKHCLEAWCRVMVWGVPSSCQGSPEIVKDWIQKKKGGEVK